MHTPLRLTAAPHLLRACVRSLSFNTSEDECRRKAEAWIPIFQIQDLPALRLVLFHVIHNIFFSWQKEVNDFMIEGHCI